MSSDNGNTSRTLGYDMGREKHAGLQKRRHVEQLSLIEGVGTEGCLVRNIITRPMSGIPRCIITCPCSEGFSHRT